MLVELHCRIEYFRDIELKELSLLVSMFSQLFSECFSASLVNSSVERCRTDDLMPNIPICCLPPSRVDPEVQGLKVIIDCPQPGSFQATYRSPPISRSSKCGSNDMVMVLLVSGMSKVPVLPEEWA